MRQEGERRNAGKVLAGNPEGKSPLGRTQHKWENTVRMYLKVTRWEGVDWSGLEWSGLKWSGLEWSGLEWIGVDSY
jgi:hypothetical protein